MFVISTRGGAVVRVPMKPRFMSARSLEFGRSVDYFGGIVSEVFENNQSLVHTQRATEISEGLVAGNGISLPLDRHFYRGTCLYNH